MRLTDTEGMNRRFAALCAAALTFGLALGGGAIELASPAHADTQYPTNQQFSNTTKSCQPLSKRITGTVRGYDGKAVDVSIGMDINTTVNGKLVRIDGGGCIGAGAGYAIQVRVNYQVPSSGVDPSTPDARTDWYADVPANATNIYFETVVRGNSSQPKYATTDQTYYGNSMSGNVAITKNPQVISTINMPVNKCGNLSTGGIKGYIYKNGKRTKLAYISAFSQIKGSGTPAGKGPFGYNNVDFTKIGNKQPVDVFHLPKLASGGGKGQAYTIIAKLPTGESKQFYMLDAKGVQHAGVLACKEVSFNLSF